MATTTQYSYTVRDPPGKIVKGKLEADSEAAVADKLQTMGYAPLEHPRSATPGCRREIKIPGSQEAGQAQGPRDHVAASSRR